MPVRPRTWYRTAVGAACLIAFTTSPAQGEEPFTDDQVVIRKEGGVQLLLPKDWPVEERHGVQSPVPIEEYLSMKFGQVKEKFSQVDQRVEMIEQRLQDLEEERAVLQRRLRLLEERTQAQEVIHGDATQGSFGEEGRTRELEALQSAPSPEEKREEASPVDGR